MVLPQESTYDKLKPLKELLDIGIHTNEKSEQKRKLLLEKL